MSHGPSQRAILVCTAVEALALAVWIGGLIVIVGAVIPAVFNTFGMEPGGRFLTRVFDGYNRLTVAAIVLLVGAMGWQGWQGRGAAGPVPPPDRLETVLLTLMILSAVLIIAVLGPRTVTLQEQAFAAQAQGEAAKKAAYDAFFRLHMVVRALYLANLGLGMALLTVKIRRWRRE